MLGVAEKAQRTDTGRQRRGNEDSCFARTPLFVVADGMGGAQAGEVASQLAVEAFEEGLPRQGTPEERLSVAVQRANRSIYERSHSDAKYDGMGTTVTAAYLDDDHVAIAHVGDSRAYRLRGGELSRLTEDHSLVGDLVRAGKLTEQEAEEHPQRSIITRALGPEPIVEVDTFSYQLVPGDVILLCSDGLTSMISERQLAEVLANAPTLERAAQRLIDEANNAGGRDNITVVLFRVDTISAAVGDDQKTTVGKAVKAPKGAQAAAGAGVPAPSPGRRAKVPLAKTQGPSAPERKRREFGLLGKSVALLLTVGFVVLLVGGAGYLATRNLFFIGTSPQGMVEIYEGLPYSLPFGLHMYEDYYVSGVPASTLPASRRSAILNHDIHGEKAAVKLVSQLELGKITG